MPYTGLRDTTIAHPRMAEGLGALFSNVLARSGSAGHWYGRNFEWYAYTNGAAGYGLRGCPAWSGMGLVSRAWPVQKAMRNCTRDEGGPFEVGNHVLTSSHRKLLSSKAMVVNVAETSGRDPGRHD